MQVNLLGISCSPRHGNTEILVRHALDAAEQLPGVQTDLLCLADVIIKGGCNLCWDCVANPSLEALCTGLNDEVNEIYHRMIEADGFIFGVPVYFMGVPSQFKAVMDRSLAVETAGFPWRNKVAGIVSIANDRNGGQEKVIQDTLIWLMMHDVVVVGLGPERPSISTGTYCGAAAMQGYPQPKFSTEDEAYAVKEDRIGMLAAHNLGKRVAEMAKVVKAGFANVGPNELAWPNGPVARAAIGFLPRDTESG